MRIKVLKRLGEAPIIIDQASLVIVESNDGVPVSVSQEFAKLGESSGIVTAHAADGEKFQRLLQQLGLERVVIVDNFEDRLAKGPGELPLLFGQR